MFNKDEWPKTREEQFARLKAFHHKIVLVGQQPQSNHKNDPLSPSHPMWSGYRLMQMAGLNEDEYRERFHRININYEPEKKFRVSGLQKAQAREIWKTLYPGDTLVILGTGVLKCFKGLVGETIDPCEGYMYSRQQEDGLWVAGHSFVLVPHPSGLNRWYNDPSNTARAAKVLRGLAEFGSY